jgi:hypothetical protein
MDQTTYNVSKREAKFMRRAIEHGATFEMFTKLGQTFVTVCTSMEMQAFDAARQAAYQEFKEQHPDA